METVAQHELQQTSRPLSPTLLLAMAWGVIISLWSVVLSVQIFNADAFDVRESMGSNVQNFFGLLALVPGILAVYSIVGFAMLVFMEREEAYHLRLGFERGTRFFGLQFDISPANARYVYIAMNYLGAVLASFYLLHLWEVFVGFDDIAGAIYENRVLLWGLVAAYFLYWLAGRFQKSPELQMRIEQVALLLATISLVVLLVSSDILAAFEHIISQYSDPIVWATTVAIIVFGIFAYRILQMSDVFDESPEQRRSWQGWLMVSPNVIGFGLFMAGPLLLSFYLSFTNAQVGQVPEFIGFDNYSEILSIQIRSQGDAQYAQDALGGEFNVIETITIFGDTLVIGGKDALFWVSLKNTILFCLMLVPLATIPAIALAVVLDSNLPGVKFYRALYFLPSVAAVVGTALIWRSALYSSQIGYINYAAQEFVGGINSLLGTNIAEPEWLWLSDPNLQLPSVVFLVAWQVVGFNTVLFLAGLQGIPNSLYEAASVDGASPWQQFRHVTLPLLGPTTFFVVVTTVINALQVFNEVFVLYPGQQVPDSVSTGVYHLYNKGFKGFEFGYASSVAWVLFALIFTITLVQFRFSRSDETQ